MIHNTTGLIHTIAAIISLIAGAFVFFTPKAGFTHKWIGYTYVVAMITVIITAFMLYHLTGSFNVLHIAAIFSSISLSLGMLAIILKKPEKNWFYRHRNYPIFGNIF